MTEKKISIPAILLGGLGGFLVGKKCMHLASKTELAMSAVIGAIVGAIIAHEVVEHDYHLHTSTTAKTHGADGEESASAEGEMNSEASGKKHAHHEGHKHSEHPHKEHHKHIHHPRKRKNTDKMNELASDAPDSIVPSEDKTSVENQ